jgi:hypothetical protein
MGAICLFLCCTFFYIFSVVQHYAENGTGRTQSNDRGVKMKETDLYARAGEPIAFKESAEKKPYVSRHSQFGKIGPGLVEGFQVHGGALDDLDPKNRREVSEVHLRMRFKKTLTEEEKTQFLEASKSVEVKQKLLRSFVTLLTLEEVVWEYRPVETPEGFTIAVIVGERTAMSTAHWNF